MVEHSADYRWSSYHYNAGLRENSLVTPHPVYLGISPEKEKRTEHYRALFSAHMPREDIHKIREAAEFSMPLGNSRFKAEIEEMLQRKIGVAKRGRPRRIQLKEEMV